MRVEAALSILEGKWKIVILNRLFARPVWRFSELEHAVPGISQRMLSQQLRTLEKCELVKRTVHPQFPPKVEYELTEFGKTLCPAMKSLVDWAMTFPRTCFRTGPNHSAIPGAKPICTNPIFKQYGYN
jgi:DNA-binding HxlR family transcriptional regulator